MKRPVDGITLAEENAIAIAGQGYGVFLQSLKEVRIGHERRWIEVRQRSPSEWVELGHFETNRPSAL